MRLSSLKVAGFKSFADSTTLYFPENRSAIVGPNGCGKSNVIDAIRWVMGESNARQLRGGSMQDVIFAGTAQRKPMSVASVELRFDNTYGKLGGAYNAYTELSIKRQVTREGKSEYFLNGTRCRRKDITDIFLGTGLGPRSYAVIEQGMINRLVDAKPEEMRVFIEEAAGVSRYQARRKDTLAHLQHTQDNLERLNDISLELQTQIKSLKKQATQAEYYQQLKIEIATYTLQILSHQYHQYTHQVDESAQQLSSLTQVYQAHHQALQQLEVEEIVLQKKVQEQLPQAEHVQHKWQEAKQTHQQLQWKIEQDQQQLLKVTHKISHVQQQQQQLREEKEQLAHVLKQGELTQLQLQQQLDELVQSQHMAEQELNDLNVAFEDQKNDFEQQKNQVQTFKQQEHQLNYQREQLQKTQQRLEQQIQQFQHQIYVLEKNDTQLELDELNIDLAQLEMKLNNLNEQSLHLDGKIQQQKADVESTKVAYQEKMLRQKNLIKEITHTEKMVAQILNQHPQPAKRPLLSQLKLSDEGEHYIHYIERILDQWLSAETSEQLDWTYEGSHQLQLSDALCVDQTPLDLPSIQTWILQPQHMLWQHIYLAQNLTQAQQLMQGDHLSNEISIVTQDGYWVAKTWLINLNHQPKQAVQGQLYYHHHLVQLQAELHSLVHSLQPLEQQLIATNKAYEQLEQQRQQLHLNTKSTQQQQQSKVQQQVKLKSQTDVQTTQLLQLQQQVEQLKKHLSEDQEEHTQLQYEHVSVQAKISQHMPRLEQAQQHFELHQRTKNTLAESLQQTLNTYQHLMLQIEQHRAKMLLQQQDANFKQEKQLQLDEQYDSCQQQKKQLQQHIEMLTRQELDAKEIFEHAQSSWFDWQAQTQQLQQQLQDYHQQRTAQQHKDHQMRDQLEQIRLQWQQHKSQQQHVLQQIQQEFQQQPLAFDIQFVLHQVQPLVEQLEAKFAKIGAINLVAFEELQLLQSRYDELKHQIEDLDQTISQLQAAMKSIDQETKHLFMKVFNQINTELQDLFPKVFTGGEASLSLEGDWQSGVRLMARPPGKRNSTLALLSGGEKALTALALVFAIFRLNPAPFCVLDEVDAPLDDANVNRFCNLVKELSQQVQFIYITHNKLAMTMATDLLGVTMPDAGSSKLVSVSLAQAEAYTA